MHTTWLWSLLTIGKYSKLLFSNPMGQNLKKNTHGLKKLMDGQIQKKTMGCHIMKEIV